MSYSSKCSIVFVSKDTLVYLEFVCLRFSVRETSKRWCWLLYGHSSVMGICVLGYVCERKSVVFVTQPFLCVMNLFNLGYVREGVLYSLLP